MIWTGTLKLFLPSSAGHRIHLTRAVAPGHDASKISRSLHRLILCKALDL
jgi:hypothetical protein